MRGVRRMPADVFAAVTRRLGGDIHWLRLGPVIIAWHRKAATPPDTLT